MRIDNGDVAAGRRSAARLMSVVEQVVSDLLTQKMDELMRDRAVAFAEKGLSEEFREEYVRTERRLKEEGPTFQQVLEAMPVKFKVEYGGKVILATFHLPPHARPTDFGDMMAGCRSDAEKWEALVSGKTDEELVEMLKGINIIPEDKGDDASSTATSN